MGKKKRNFEKGTIALAELLWMTLVFVIAIAVIIQLTVAVTGMQWAHVYSRNHGMISVKPHEFDFKLLSMDTIDLISNFISNLGDLNFDSLSSAISSVGGIFTSVFTGGESVGDTGRYVKIPILIPFGESFGVEEYELNKIPLSDNRTIWGYYGIRVE
ncbi:MAG: hypothetical protein ACUVUG_03605 [Candidatus Aminicenantia bacterium]